MTIIKKTSTLSRYPFIYLEEGLVAELTSAYVVHKNNKIVKGWREDVFKLLECYCHLNNQKIRKSDLGCQSTQDFIQDFFRVLKGDSLLPTDATHKSFRYHELSGALATVYRNQFGNRPEGLDLLPWHEVKAKNLNLEDFDSKDLLYWSGWPAYSRKGKAHFLDLTSLYHSHGREFTTQYYSRWAGFFKKQAAPNRRHIDQFARYLSENSTDWPPSVFKNPVTMSQCFKAFLKDYFLKVHRDGKDLGAQIKAWNRFIANVQEVFIQPGVWPEPFGNGLPILPSRPVAGVKTNISKNESGVEVHSKLVTEIPLKYTDDQAIEVLFSQIDKDLKTVECWAKSQVWSLRRRQLQRKNLAKVGDRHAPDQSKRRSRTIIAAEAPNLCAKFEHFGFLTSQPSNPELDVHKIYGWHLNKSDLAHLFGLPTLDSLFPFMCLLVIDNPKITHGFLQDFELFDKHGQLSGFIKTDAGYLLTGYKDRRQKELAEQKIILSPRSSVLVRQIIEVTKPLRNYLRANGDDAWRRLFLTCGKGFSYPKAGAMTYWSNEKYSKGPNFARLEKQFSEFTSLRGANLKKFLTRVNLGSLRASRGVQIYLTTNSGHKMAEALGHAKYSPKLLSHYLPDAILAFFQTRWVRIFQKAFLFEAMKDSPYLLKATDFSSMEELHEFLRNHALKDIPAHLSNPENDSDETSSSSDQVLISVDAGILSALLSVNRAVTQSLRPAQISGLAKYWSRISELIEREILQGNDALLKQHLSHAKGNLDPKKMEALIYESAA